MDLLGILGVTGTLLTIFAFFFPLEWKNKRVFKIVFFTIIALLSSTIVYLNLKISRIEKISKSAEALIQQKAHGFTDEGFILASLSFLEQNKKDFPDSYERAIKIFESYNNSRDKRYESLDVSSELEGLLKGIAILSTVDEE